MYFGCFWVPLPVNRLLASIRSCSVSSVSVKDWGGKNIETILIIVVNIALNQTICQILVLTCLQTRHRTFNQC